MSREKVFRDIKGMELGWLVHTERMELGELFRLLVDSIGDDELLKDVLESIENYGERK